MDAPRDPSPAGEQLTLLDRQGRLRRSPSLSRRLYSLGHDARLMPAKYVKPSRKGQKNDFRDAEAIAEAVQRPTMKFVATKTTGSRSYFLVQGKSLGPSGASLCRHAPDAVTALDHAKF